MFDLFSAKTGLQCSAGKFENLKLSAQGQAAQSEQC